MAPLSNKSANQLIKKLYKSNNRNAIRRDVVDQGYAIYSQIKEPRNHFVVNTFLKLCNDFKYPQKALSIGDDIHRLLHESDSFAVNANHLSIPLLLNVYGQCSLHETERIFQSLPQPLDISVIGAMMNVYIQNDVPNEAIKLYENNSFHNNNLTHNLAIKACTKSLNLVKGREIHRNLGVIDNIQILNSLIHFYGTCGDLQSALSIFRSINTSQRDIVTFNTMMMAFIQNDDSPSALTLYDELHNNCGDTNHSLIDRIDDRCHMLAIKACINILNFDRGKSIHQKLKQRLKSMDIQLSTTLIDFYSAFKDIYSAMDIFNVIPQSQRSIICNNAMLTALIHCDYHQEALTLYDSIKYSKRNETTHMLAIKACIECNQYRNGMDIIDRIQSHSPKKLEDIALNTKIIEFHGHFGDIESAKGIYRLIDSTKRNVIQQTSMMNAFYVNNYHEEALAVFKEIENDQRSDSVSSTFAMKCYLKLNEFQKCLDLYRSLKKKEVSMHVLAIRTCIEMNDHSTAISIHQQMKNEDDNVFLRNPNVVKVLIECYSRFGDISTASSIFNDFISKDDSMDVLNAMMKAYIENDLHHHALDFYDEQVSKLSHSDDSELEDTNSTNHDVDKLHILAIKACSTIGDAERGRRIHELCDLKGATSNVAVRTSLIDMYGALEDVESAMMVFDSLHDSAKNVVIVNSMMNVLYKNGQHTECMEMFRKSLEKEPLQQDVIFYTIILASCIESGNVSNGKEVHEALRRDKSKHWILNHDEIATNLIHFYGREGMLDECERIFGGEEKEQDQHRMRSVAVWNAMIHSYGMNGNNEKAKNLFDRMHDENKKSSVPPPDRKTYIHIINAFSHCGNVSMAVEIWRNCIKSEEIKHDDFVLSALIDCLSRNGDVHEAFDYITRFNVGNDVAWIALMSGCKLSNDLDLARIVLCEMRGRFGDTSPCVQAAFKIFPSLLTRQ